jgi:hypothetical protein
MSTAPPGSKKITDSTPAFAAVVGTAERVLHLCPELDDGHILTGEETPLLFTHAGLARPSLWPRA